MSLSTGSLFAATQVISSGMSLVNSYSQSQALKAQGKAAQQSANTQAAWQDIQAQDALMRGAQEEGQQKTRTRQMIAAQRAAQGAQGLDPNEGSALLLQEDTAGMGALDALTIRTNAQREAMGLTSRAMTTRADGRSAWLAARNQASQSIISGGLQATRDITYGAYGLSKYGSAPPPEKNAYYGDQG